MGSDRFRCFPSLFSQHYTTRLHHPSPAIVPSFSLLPGHDLFSKSKLPFISPSFHHLKCELGLKIHRREAPGFSSSGPISTVLVRSNGFHDNRNPFYECFTIWHFKNPRLANSSRSGSNRNELKHSYIVPWSVPGTMLLLPNVKLNEAVLMSFSLNMDY